MIKISHILIALLLAGCASTKKAVQAERVDQTHVERVETKKDDTITERKEETERVKITEVVEEIIEEVQPDPVLEVTDSVHVVGSHPKPVKKTTKRTTRTVEGEKKAVAEIVQADVEEKAEIIEEAQHVEEHAEAVEVEPTMPRNLRWLGIIALCAFGVYLLTFIKKLKK